MQHFQQSVIWKVPICCCKEEVWAYLKGREEPKEEVAVVFLVDSKISSIAFDVGTRKISNQTQFPGWKSKDQNVVMIRYVSVIVLCSLT